MPRTVPFVARLAFFVVLGFGFMLVLAARVDAATGPDVSNYQHPNNTPINWPQVRGAGHTFAYVKATEGPSGAGGYYTNPWFATDWQQAGSAGLYRGAYHFARPQYPLDSSVLQARYFVAATGLMQGSIDLPPVLDLESTGGLPRGDLATWTQGWLSEVERLTGRRPIIYSGYYFWNDNVNSTAFSGYRLWIPRYTSANNPFPLPNGWPTWTLWQYTSSASVPGIVGNVDMNAFCCPDSNLAALANGSGSNPAAGNPFGSLDSATRLPGRVDITGWAIDPDTRGALAVHIYVDGQFHSSISADAVRGDVSAAYPGWGNHGFGASLTVGPGDHQVCAYAINQGVGTTNTTLGCRVAVGNPIGAYDSAASFSAGSITVSGWAIDPDTAGPIQVHVYVDGQGRGVGTADVSRPDVAALFPATGADHGYSVTVGPMASGSHQVCVYAINVGSGNNVLLGCRGADVLASNPIGNLDAASGGAGAVLVRGWSIDPDTFGPINVHVYVDGVATPLQASDPRSDIAAAYPLHGANHGFSGFIGGLAPGGHTACAYGINVGPGANAFIGCRSFTVPTGPPWGAVDEVTAGQSFINVRGWALDPDTTAPIGVHVYVDGRKVGETVAGAARGDIAAAFPAFGANHGYFLSVGGIGGGAHSVCAYGLNQGAGNNALLGCWSVITSGSPFGNVDSVVASGGGSTIQASGWAIDPDSTGPINVHVYVDGVGRAILTANQPRGDVGAAYPSYGPNHGFTATVNGLGAGTHNVCVYAINVGAPGPNSLLGCQTV